MLSEDKNLLTSMAVFRVSALPPIGNPESYRCLIASNDQQTRLIAFNSDEVFRAVTEMHLLAM